MKPNDLVSIVVPSYNQAHYLETALASVMFQDYKNIEIIICNHGSTDNTSEIIQNFIHETKHAEVSFLKEYDEQNNTPFIRKYENKYPAGRKIVVLESKENIGGTASYNEGFKVATGKYCTYLVGDDVLLPTAVSEMVETLEKNGCDFVYADMLLIDNQGRNLQNLIKPDYSFKACFADWFHLGVCRLYRKELHDQVGLYDPNYKNANDYDMYLRFAMGGASFKHINKTLYCVRKHDSQGQSEPASWRNNGYENLMQESIQCSKRARIHLENLSNEKK